MAQFDFEEIAPGHFLLNHPQLRGLVKREGEIQGRFFVLTSWRREGMLARLRMRGFSIRTIADGIAGLPALPAAAPPGPALDLDLSSFRISTFDPQRLHWTPLPAQTQLRDGQPVRQRRGRGVPAYGLAGAGGLRPLGEQSALLLAYAQAAPTSATLTPLPDERWQLPEAELPAPHRALLRRIVADDGVLTAAGLELAVALYARLGVVLTGGET